MINDPGMIKGSGTLVLGNGGTFGNPGTETLTNNGWVAPGASPGTSSTAAATATRTT